MSKLKLMTIIGTRPEIIRLAAVIKKCDKYFDQILVHTGQNYDYELNQVFFDDLGLRAPDFYLDAVGKDLGEQSATSLQKAMHLWWSRSLMHCLSSATQTAVFPPSVQRDCTFLSSIWKQATAVLTNVCRKKQTAELLTILQT